jgi:hypothetical protein
MLESYIKSDNIDENLSGEIIRLLDEWGAAVYIQAEIEKHRTRALEALSLARPNPPAGEELVANIHEMG